MRDLCGTRGMGSTGSSVAAELHSGSRADHGDGDKGEKSGEFGVHGEVDVWRVRELGIVEMRKVAREEYLGCWM